MRIFGVLLMVLTLAACDPNRVYEQNVDLEDAIWVKDQKVAFDIEITGANQAYNLYANIRNAQHYPYSNLYYQFELSDTTGKVLEKKLQHLSLFEVKTGEPLGSGLGDVFDHQQLILQNFQFPAAGKYHLTFEQFMRVDTLPLIVSMGARVETIQK